MSDFKAKMHQNQFRLGFPQTPLGELTALPQTPSWIYGAGGPTSKGMGIGREGKGRGRQGEGKKGRGG